MRLSALLIAIAAAGLLLISCGGDSAVKLPLALQDGGISPGGASSGIYPIALRPGEPFTATYVIRNPNTKAVNVRLGLSIIGPDGAIPDRLREASCPVPAQAERHVCTRPFIVPTNARPGRYAVDFELWSGATTLPSSVRYASASHADWLTIADRDTRLAAIAERYAPALHLARRDFAPMPVDILLDHSSLRLSRDTQPVLRRPSPAPLINSIWNKPTSFLDVPDLEPKGNRILDHTGARNLYNAILRENKGRYPVTLYARAGAKDGRFFIQYWLFYFFNDYYNDHEGDWEWLQVNFATDDLAAIASGTPPVELVYSRHGVGAARPWPAVEKLGSAPVVYVGAGSHANYFDDEDERQDSKSSHNEDETYEDRTFTPDEYVIALISDDAPWLQFQGMWGEQSLPSGFSGPRGPMWQRLENGARDPWNDPFGWYPSTR